MVTPRRDIGIVVHIPLTEAIKTGDVRVLFIPADLDAGRALADTLTALRQADGSGMFGEPIVAPSPSPDVEHDPGGDDARHVASPPAARTKYRDMAATPAQLEDVAYLNDHPDEGDDVDPDTVAAIGKVYNALPDARRSWVTSVAAKIRLNPSTGGVASERRRLLLESLIALSADFDEDDIVRGICHRYLGDVAHFANVTPAELVGALGIDEARKFAKAAKALIAGNASVRWDLERRCYVEPSVAA